MRGMRLRLMELAVLFWLCVLLGSPHSQIQSSQLQSPVVQQPAGNLLEVAGYRKLAEHSADAQEAKASPRAARAEGRRRFRRGAEAHTKQSKHGLSEGSSRAAFERKSFNVTSQRKEHFTLRSGRHKKHTDSGAQRRKQSQNVSSTKSSGHVVAAAGPAQSRKFSMPKQSPPTAVVFEPQKQGAEQATKSAVTTGDHALGLMGHMLRSSSQQSAQPQSRAEGSTAIRLGGSEGATLTGRRRGEEEPLWTTQTQKSSPRPQPVNSVVDSPPTVTVTAGSPAKPTTIQQAPGLVAGAKLSDVGPRASNKTSGSAADMPHAYGEGTEFAISGRIANFTVELSGWTAAGISQASCGAIVSAKLRRRRKMAYAAYVVGCEAMVTNRTANASAPGVHNSACRIPDELGRCEVYHLTYTPYRWGHYKLAVQANSKSAYGSPFEVFVAPPLWYPFSNESTVLGATDEFQYGSKLDYFTVVPRNYYGERTNSCDATVAAAIHGIRKIPVSVSCEFDPTATYYLSTDEVVEDGSWALNVLMDGTHVKHSPLNFIIRPGVSARHSLVFGEGLREAVAGRTEEVVLRLKMHNDINASDCREPAALVLVEKHKHEEVSLVAEDDNSTKTGGTDNSGTIASHTTALGQLQSCSSGEYHFSYMVTAAGLYSMSVLVGKKKELVGGHQFEIDVLPGSLSSQHCGLVGKHIGTGTMVYGSLITFGLFLRDSYGNYISCEYYGRGASRHNISHVAVSHEPAEESSGHAGWEVEGRVLSRCRDNVFHDGGVSVVDGVVDVQFRIPRPEGETSTKEVALDLDVKVNGRRLRDGPYVTVIRPARLDPQASVVLGLGTRGSEPAEHQVLALQLINELGENMTSCGSVGAIVGVVNVQDLCAALKTAAECQANKDCDWLAVADGAGACSAVQRSELVEMFLQPLEDSGHDAEVTQRLVGQVQACDHGVYTLSYAMTERGRYELFIRIAGKDVFGSPFRVVVAPGCRSGSVLFPCLGRGLCLHDGSCECTSGYLGDDCNIGCPALEEDGTFCTGRGNCSLPANSNVPVCGCLYGFYGRHCEKECPGGQTSVCSNNGICLDNGECDCWPGYAGEKCQFRTKEVQSFGSLSALLILLSMAFATAGLVAWILVQKAVQRRRGERFYQNMHSAESQRPTSNQIEEMQAHWLLDCIADQIIDRERRQKVQKEGVQMARVPPR